MGHAVNGCRKVGNEWPVGGREVGSLILFFEDMEETTHLHINQQPLCLWVGSKRKEWKYFVWFRKVEMW